MDEVKNVVSKVDGNGVNNGVNNEVINAVGNVVSNVGGKVDGKVNDKFVGKVVGKVIKIAYLIIAYNNPEQLNRLVRRILSENSHVYIHLDKKVIDRQYFYSIVEGLDNVAFISNCTKVYWGGYSIIQAMLNGLQEILEAGTEYDYIAIMSGSDYPIKSPEYINNFYAMNYGHEFIHYRQLPINGFHEGRMDMVWYYYDYDNIYTACNVNAVCNANTSYTVNTGCNANTSYNISTACPGGLSYESEMRKRGIRRSFISGMQPYHGSTWWSLTAGCIRYILRLLDENPEIINFYRYTKIPDEQFFQTLVMNSPFSANAHNENLWYVDWSDAKSPHPKTLGTSDFPWIKDSPYLYARKFDMARDSRVLDMLDDLTGRVTKML